MSFLTTLADKFGFGGRDSHVQNLGVQTNLTTQELVNLMGGAMASSSGAVVSESTAMRVSAVYSCVALIAGAISTLPINVYQRTPKGREQVDHPYWWILNEEPDPEVSSAVFWEYMVTARLFYGDCFAEIIRPSWRSSAVSGLKAHHPLRVQPFRDAQGSMWYRITPIVGPQYVLPPSEILHIPSLGYDGLSSPSPITYAAQQAVGTSLATGEYNAKFFANGARPDFVLQTDSALNKEQAELIRSTWASKHGGVGNAHMPAVLTGGLKAQPLTLNAVDSQILETANWNLEEVCRVLGVPPFMVGSTEKSTSWGTGQENMGRGFVKYTLLRDLVKIQKEINRKFWPSRETYFVEYDVSGIERGDLKSENEAMRVALGRAGEPGWLTVNEVRKMKLLKPIKGGDELLKAVAPTPAPAPADPNAAPAADKANP